MWAIPPGGGGNDLFARFLGAVPPVALSLAFGQLRTALYRRLSPGWSSCGVTFGGLCAITLSRVRAFIVIH